MRIHGGIKPLTGLIKFSAPLAGVPPTYDLLASVIDVGGQTVTLAKAGPKAANFTSGTVYINEFTWITVTFKVPVIMPAIYPFQVFSGRAPQMQTQYTKDGVNFIPVDTSKGSLGRVFRYANVGDQFGDGKGSILAISGIYFN